MFKIVRIPPKLKSFFDPLQNQLHFNHFEYFQTLILLFGIRLYVKKEDCKGLGVEFKKTTQLAAELISEFKPPEGAQAKYKTKTRPSTADLQNEVRRIVYKYRYEKSVKLSNIVTTNYKNFLPLAGQKNKPNQTQSMPGMAARKPVR